MDACALSAAQELDLQTTALLPQITNIKLEWEDDHKPYPNINTCSPTDCVGVKVTIVGLNYQWISPIAGAAVALSPIPIAHLLDIPDPGNHGARPQQLRRRQYLFVTLGAL